MIERPLDISTNGYLIDDLITQTNILVGMLTVVFLTWLAIALVRGSRRNVAKPQAKKRWQRWIPFAFAAFILFVVDGNLFVQSSLDLHRVFLATKDAEASQGAVRVEINGQQWAWNIRYAGPDGLFATTDDPVVTGDWVVPINVPVIIQLASSDVVHALYLPNVRIKRDAIPGRLATVWFKATALGEFDMLCGQFCGTAHYRMRGTMKVVSMAAFERWQAAATADSLSIDRENERSLLDEPGRQPRREVWPSFGLNRFGRNWGWPWESQ